MDAFWNESIDIFFQLHAVEIIYLKYKQLIGACL